MRRGGKENRAWTAAVAHVLRHEPLAVAAAERRLPERTCISRGGGGGGGPPARASRPLLHQWLVGRAHQAGSSTAHKRRGAGVERFIRPSCARGSCAWQARASEGGRKPAWWEGKRGGGKRIRERGMDTRVEAHRGEGPSPPQQRCARAQRTVASYVPAARFDRRGCGLRFFPGTPVVGIRPRWTLHAGRSCPRGVKVGSISKIEGLLVGFLPHVRNH